MSNSNQQNNESTAIAESTEVYLDWSFGNKIQGRVIASALQKIRLLPSVRKKKILKVRQQLSEGTYNFDEKLDVALDHLLEDLTS